jgi:hypothetical protein
VNIVAARSASLVALALLGGCASAPAESDAADTSAPSESAVVAVDVASAFDATLDAPAPVPDVLSMDDSAMDASPPDALADALTDAAADRAIDVQATDARGGDAGRRSAFFAVDWRPAHAGGRPDAMGRILPDFSYSGYHQGIEPPPCGARPVVVTVDRALGNGTTDATAGIQSAIDRACAMGGGAVLIPAGTYRLTFAQASPATSPALSLSCSNVALRGEGPSTRLWLDDPLDARGRALLTIGGTGSIYDAASTTTWALTASAPTPTRSLSIAAGATLRAGDWIAIRQENTAEFRADHQMTDPACWPATGFQGIVYLRRVTSFAGGALGIDAPTMYPLTTRDRARVYRVSTFTEEVGVESLAIGMTLNGTSTVREPDDDNSYDSPSGTTPYQVHASRAIEFNRVHDAWVCDVSSFRPAGNRQEVHLLSKGIVFATNSARVTVARSSLGFPQYRGGGGNGYFFEVLGSDVMIRDSETRRARHGLILNYAASGTVFLRNTIRDSRLSDDAHRFLAHANLYDSIALDRAWLQCVNRGTTSTGAGFTGTQHVFWNTRVLANHSTVRTVAVESAQWGHGYLLGSTAAPGASAVLRPQSFSNSGWAALAQQGDPPRDTVEAEGVALDPPSLYEAQRALRCARESLPCR